jgi:hypothetical protein
LVLPLMSQVEQSDRVLYQLAFETVIELAFSGQTGSVVDFQQPWLQLVVDYDVEA